LEPFLQNVGEPVTSGERSGDERISLVSCSYHRRYIVEGAKVQINVLAPKIGAEIKLSRVHRGGWKRKLSLADDAVAVQERLAGGFREYSEPRWSIVDAANQRYKPLSRTKLINLRLALHQQRHGMLNSIKGLLSTSLIAGIGCNLISVPEGENEEGY
jgi:hypothetical protein